MTRRDRTAYADMAARQPAPARAGQDISQPVAGFFRTKLNSRGVAVGVRIWFGPPHDPVTGEEMDRSWRWQAECNGRPMDIDKAWPDHARTPIDAHEYAYLTGLQAWGEEHAPGSPEANPRKAINWLTAPLGI